MYVCFRFKSLKLLSQQSLLHTVRGRCAINSPLYVIPSHLYGTGGPGPSNTLSPDLWGREKSGVGGKGGSVSRPGS